MLRVPKKGKEYTKSGNNTGSNEGIYSKLNKKPQSNQTAIALSLLVAFFLLGAIFLDKSKENVKASIHPSKLTDNRRTIPIHKKEQQTSHSSNSKPPPQHSPPITLTPTTTIIYGSQDKGDKTASLVKEAILAGFRHIASAGYHVKYNESGTGAGITAAIAEDNTISRGDLFLQTMYVPQNNGDRSPTTKSDSSSIEDDVHRSIQSSLAALRTNYLDAVIYHNFRNKLDPFEDTMTAWTVLESYVTKGIVKHLGIDHVYHRSYLERLCREARIPPSIVQNRFHANRNFDVDLHSFFVAKGIQAQKFWVLTGNGGPLHKNRELKAMATEKGLTPQLLMYAFVMEIGIVPLIGTRRREHMEEDVKLWRRMKGGEVFFNEEEKRNYAKYIGMKYEVMIK